MRIIRNYNKFPTESHGGVVALGNFDGIHLGHQTVIGKAVKIAQKENLASTVITFNPHPINILRPEKKFIRINNLRTKYNLLSKLGVDNLCIINFNKIFSQISAEDFIANILCKSLAVKHIVIGYDFIFGHNRSGNAQILKELGKKYGYELHQLSAEKNNEIICSSTKIRCFLQAGEVEKANEMLGYNYIIEGRVIKGKQLGRTIGFPTANIDLARYSGILFGVYAVRVAIEDSNIYLNSIANIGIKPTFNAQKPLLELHIFDFNENIYGKRINVELIKYIRPEKKFNDIEELKTQIHCDIMVAKSI